VPYLSASEVVIHYEDALYQVYSPLALPEIWPVWLLLLSDPHAKYGGRRN